MYKVSHWAGPWYYRTLEEAEARVAEGIAANPHSDSPYEITEVDRADRPCVHCGRQVEAEKPEVDICRSCFYSGRSMAAPQSVVEALRNNPLVDAETLGIWHTGGGCFSLGAILKDRVGTDGREMNILCGTESMDPTQEPSKETPWCVCVEGDDGMGVMSEYGLTDAEMVSASVSELVAAWDSGRRDW